MGVTEHIGESERIGVLLFYDSFYYSLMVLSVVVGAAFLPKKSRCAGGTMDTSRRLCAEWQHVFVFSPSRTVTIRASSVGCRCGTAA